MATTLEFLRDYGVDIRTNGQRRWPDEIKARYGLRANHLSEWRSRARDGRLVLPAVEDDSFCFAPIVVSDGGGAEVPAVAGQPTKPDGLSCKPIEIAIGRVTIRVDGTISSDRIAEIVRAIGTRP